MKRYYILLFISISCEAFGTTMMKASDGFSHPLPTALFIVAYVMCFTVFTFALRGLELGVAYGIWSGVGVAAISIIGAVLWGKPLNAAMVGGIALIVAGVVLLESSGRKKEDAS